MREIKFRAWFEGHMYEVAKLDFWPYQASCDLVGTGENENGEWEEPLFDIYVSDVKLMQSTGLKDKNGKEIYEGDIVAFEDSDGGYEYPDLAVNTGIVEYGELGFYFTNRVAVEMDDFYIKDGRCDDIEVIGNIYEQEQGRDGGTHLPSLLGGEPQMTKIHTADDGWQFAEVEFKSTISESEFCICDACHKTGEVMKLTLPETAYHRNGQLSTKYREYWLCPPCRRKLVHALDWPEETTKTDFEEDRDGN